MAAAGDLSAECVILLSPTIRRRWPRGGRRWPVPVFSQHMIHLQLTYHFSLPSINLQYYRHPFSVPPSRTTVLSGASVNAPTQMLQVARRGPCPRRRSILRPPPVPVIVCQSVMRKPSNVLTVASRSKQKTSWRLPIKPLRKKCKCI